jgi:Ni,Fe-hydrogenase maturation factor
LSIDEAVGVEIAANLKALTKAAVVAFAVVAVDDENDTVDLLRLLIGRKLPLLVVVFIVVHAKDPQLLPYSRSNSITANDGRE